MAPNSNNNITTAAAVNNNSNKKEPKTIWVRSNPVDKTKQFKEGHAELDLSNIINGTRRRKNVNYRKCHLNGEKIEVKRKSVNCLEERATRGIKKQQKTRSTTSSKK